MPRKGLTEDDKDDEGSRPLSSLRVMGNAATGGGEGKKSETSKIKGEDSVLAEKESQERQTSTEANAFAVTVERPLQFTAGNGEVDFTAEINDLEEAAGEEEEEEEESAVRREQSRDNEDSDENERDDDVAAVSDAYVVKPKTDTNAPIVDAIDVKRETEKTFLQRYGAWVASFLLIVVLVAVLAATLTKEKEIVVRSLVPTSMPTMSRTTNDPTSSPTTFLESGRTFSPTSDRFIDVVEEVLRQFESPTLEADLLNPRSPQFRAALWMAEVDAHNATSEIIFPLTNETHFFATWEEVVEFRQRYALVTFFYSTRGEEWVDKCNFLSPELHVCDWQCPLSPDVEGDPGLGAFLSSPFMGVTCVDELDIVVELQIGFNRLSGMIPDELQGLDYLRNLHLPGNSLSGTIPFDAIANNLGTKLNVGDPMLSTVILSANLLEGSISSDALSPFTNLAVVFVQDNLITGTVPTFLGMGLLVLWAYENQLSGSLPDSIFNITILDLSTNTLTGTIPEFNSTISSIEWLLLEGNSLSGSIPDSIRYLVNLETLRINGNAFTGSLPSGLGELERLVHLMLEQNQFSGTVLEDDSFLYKLTNLELFHLGENQFSGTISSQIDSLSKIERFSIGFSEYQENTFTGPLPTEIGLLTRLSSFAASRNKLTGTIPTEIGQLSQNLEVLTLNGNDLTGTIPTELSLLTKLSYLTIQSNSRLSGSLDGFCTDAWNGLGSVAIIADCQEETVECSCCTTCCNFAGECEAV